MKLRLLLIGLFIIVSCCIVFRHIVQNNNNSVSKKFSVGDTVYYYPTIINTSLDYGISSSGEFGSVPVRVSSVNNDGTYNIITQVTINDRQLPYSVWFNNVKIRR